MLAVELLTPPGGMGRGQHRPGDGTQDSDDVVTAEQQVLIVGRLRGRTRSTEVEVDSPMGWLLTFEGDKVKRLRTYTDVVEAREAAGLGRS